jgi:hypothetical protein
MDPRERQHHIGATLAHQNIVVVDVEVLAFRADGNDEAIGDGLIAVARECNSRDVGLADRVTGFS